jgi:hypothetical protein
MQNCHLLPWGSCSLTRDLTRERDSREARRWAGKGLGRGGRLNWTGRARTTKHGSSERARTVQAAPVTVRARRGGERVESLSEWR